MNSFWPKVILCLSMVTRLQAMAGSASPDNGPAFFESKVRPILEQRCFECHSHQSGKTKGGLTLDSRNGWSQGGESGPAIVPGRTEDSLLIKAVRRQDKSLQMPPKQKLSADEIAILEKWVTLGAPDPRVGSSVAAKNGNKLEKGRQHWAFQPIRDSAPPKVKAAHWARSPLDQFVLARLEHEGLKPNPPAERRVLIRRVYFDLIGLPPTFEEVEAFAAERSPDAFARVVDRLLARPEYGQRWARHWLDVARYSDTLEQSVDGERRIPFAHTYRDYVIDAFNADKPFDRFIVEQIAADRLPAADHADLRALGFLTVGRHFRSNADGPNLIIDDQIDTIGRGFLGLTIACARCHDHKFDPIPTADYYALFGILGSMEEPLDLPLTRSAEDSEAVKKYLAEREKLLREYDAHVDACMATANQHFRDLATEYLQYVVRSSPNHRTTEGYVPHDTPRGLLYYEAPARWQALLEQCRQKNEPFFRLWHQLMALPREKFSGDAPPILADLSAHPGAYHPAVITAFREQSPASMLDAATIYGGIISNALKNAASDSAYITNLIFGSSSPVPPADRHEVAEDIHRFLTEKCLVNRADGEKGDGIRQKLFVLETTAPIERAQAVCVAARPLDPHVLVRGDAKRPGDAVPRRFLTVLAAVDHRNYTDDGRLELAQAVASTNNPLTARVIVNRVWQHHFGSGLVETPDNFGAMGEAPSHPELLDHLATWFMEHGWSVKELHRYILTSATWQQSSATQQRAEMKDPANRLLWRASPHRLEFEPLRDSLLQVAGRLDTHTGGRSAPLADTNLRRAVYGYTDRFRIPALLRNFDVANPDTSISRRSETLVPLQALHLLNSSFVRQQAEALLRRPEMSKPMNTPDRVATAFRLVLSRQPAKDELKLALEYVGQAQRDEAGTRQWSSFVQGLLMSNEFVFVD